MIRLFRTCPGSLAGLSDALNVRLYEYTACIATANATTLAPRTTSVCLNCRAIRFDSVSEQLGPKTGALLSLSIALLQVLLSGDPHDLFNVHLGVCTLCVDRTTRNQ